ncbi:MAG: hypothetical protein M3O86_01735 [Actinomycetota bacterium]|nr:hypothetical protein [Actinomycetota bacterium]
MDFNSLDEDGLYPTLTKFAAASVSAGERVVAFDHDGNEAEAIVASVDGDALRLQVDLGTFNETRGLVNIARPSP